MDDWKRKLAYYWCRDYGDAEHHKRHHDPDNTTKDGKFNLWCRNCRDGLSFINDVIRTIKERF